MAVYVRPEDGKLFEVRYDIDQRDFVTRNKHYSHRDYPLFAQEWVTVDIQKESRSNSELMAILFNRVLEEAEKRGADLVHIVKQLEINHHPFYSSRTFEVLISMYKE